MEITSGEVTAMFPCNNWVLLRPLQDNSKIKTESGVELYMDTDYKPENHAKVLCEVLAIPKQLIYNKKRKEYSMEWKTEMNVKIGEKVIINYLKSLDAEKYNHFVVNGEKLYLVPYSSLYLAMRNNQIIMLNGYMLMEQISKKSKFGSILAPNEYEFKKGNRRAIVRYMHEPNLEYIYQSHVDDDIMSEGDQVILSYGFNRKAENELHKILDKDYLVVQRYQIAAVLK